MNYESHTYLGEIQSGYGAAPLYLTRAQRFEHIAAVGATGVGKSVLLRSIASGDILRGDGVLFIDPHGDSAEALLDLVPRDRANAVCYLRLADLAFPIALNVLECDEPDGRAEVADALVSALRDIWFDSMTAAPRMELILRHAVIALLHVPNATLPMIGRLLTDSLFRSDVVPLVDNLITRRFFEDRFDKWREAFKAEAIEPILTRLDTILSFPAVLNCLGQHQRTLRIDKAMQGRRIIIVNLASIGETAAHVMGALLLARVRAAALARARMAAEDRVDFHVVVDEVQRYSTNSLPSLLAEARKFNVSLTYATQMISSLNGRTQAALLGSTGATIAFRIGPQDAPAVAARFGQVHRDFSEYGFNELGTGQAFAKVGDGDARRIVCPEPPLGFATAELIGQQSRRHYARPRGEVEQWLKRAL